MKTTGLRIIADSSKSLTTQFLLPDGSSLGQVRSFAIHGSIDTPITADVEIVSPTVDVITEAAIHNTSISNACGGIRSIMLAIIRHAITDTPTTTKLRPLADSIITKLNELEDLLNE